MAANTPLPTFGATSTTTLTTSISLPPNQKSFTIFYPPKATLPTQDTIFPGQSYPTITYTPTSLPILILTNIVGIAISTNGQPIEIRTLTQQPPPQATNTPVNNPGDCDAWRCWNISKQALVGTAIAVGGLLVVALAWWVLFWRQHIKKIRIRARKPPRDVELGERGRPASIRVRTSSHIGRPRRRRDETPTPSPPPGSGPGSEREGIRVVASGQNQSETPAYRVIRQPSPREFERPLQMPEPMVSMGGTGSSERPPITDFVMPISAAIVGAGAAIASSRKGSIRVSRGEPEVGGLRRTSLMGSSGLGGREDCGILGAREQRRERKDGSRRTQTEQFEDQRKSHNRRERKERDGERRRDRRGRGREEEDLEVRRRNRSYEPRDKDLFEGTRDRSPSRGPSRRDRDRRRPRSVSPPPRENSKDKKKERRRSTSGGLSKYLSLLPLIFSLVHTYAEPEGGWDQYVPEEKRKKGKIKKLAEDVFDKHHKKIPSISHHSSPRSKSANRAYESTHPQRRPSGRESRYEDRAYTRKPVRNMREAFNSTTPEVGSDDNPSVLSSPPRRRRSTREHGREKRRGHGYDGADDSFEEDGRVPYGSERESWREVSYTEPVPKGINFRRPPVSSGVPLVPGMEDKLKDIPKLLKQPTSPTSIS